MNVVDIIFQELKSSGIRHIFGLPGTQNVALYEGLRKSGIHCITPVHELSASFMANGYARASGRTGVLLTIPGPGFTYALTGLAEAFLDSVPLLYLLIQPYYTKGNKFRNQEIDHLAIAKPLVKAQIHITHPRDIVKSVKQAIQITQIGEPGPVLLYLDEQFIHRPAKHDKLRFDKNETTTTAPATESQNIIDNIFKRMTGRRKIVYFMGQGAHNAGSAINKLIDRYPGIVMTTTSARGILDEKNPAVFAPRLLNGEVELFNQLLSAADIVLALGCKFSSNGTLGFQLKIEPDKLIHIDASAEVLNANYPASIALNISTELFVENILKYNNKNNEDTEHTGWPVEQLTSFRKQYDDLKNKEKNQVLVEFGQYKQPDHFFNWLQSIVPQETIFVTDSGYHQMLARKFLTLSQSRSLILPTNFQSMGYAVPAAIGAKLANPTKHVCVLVGDGGFMMNPMDLINCQREKAPITVFIFTDGKYGLIFLQQLYRYGRRFATDLNSFNIEKLAQSLDLLYMDNPSRVEDYFNKGSWNHKTAIINVAVKYKRRVHFAAQKNKIKQTIEQLSAKF